MAYIYIYIYILIITFYLDVFLRVKTMSGHSHEKDFERSLNINLEMFHLTYEVGAVLNEARILHLDLYWRVNGERFFV